MDEELSSGELLLNKKSSKALTVILDILIVLFAAIAIFYYLFAFTRVDGYSMENTVYDNQSIILLKRGYTLQRNDIIIIDVSENGSKNHVLIKRAIALGGDKLIFARSADRQSIDLYICKTGETHFKKLDEPYIKEKMKTTANYYDTPILNNRDQNRIEEIDITKDEIGDIADFIITVPENYVYFMGDNRNNSTDSRYYGARKITDIIGKALYFPEKDSLLEKFMRFMFLEN